MVKPITCPNCGAQIKLENEDYTAIVNQVRTAEFNEEVERRISEEKKHVDEAIKLAESSVRLKMQEQLSVKDREILELNKRNEVVTNQAVKTVRQYENSLSELKISTQAEISKLQEQLRAADERQKTAVNNAVIAEQQNSKDKDVEIARLKELINTNKANADLKMASLASSKDQEISELNAKIVSIQATYDAREASSEEKFREQLRLKDEEVKFYKDFKAKQSTKIIGESLETHCSAEYAKIRPLMPNSSFAKDNTISESGSKGDFIFRDYDGDGTECLSIMFEMKNEADDSLHKHKNSDFFKELDKDRKEKGCEYAILVTMLEADNDLYNQGIVDVSDQYPKMYVIRPQFFIPIITLLHSISTKTILYKKELNRLKNQSIDVSTFEEDLQAFKDSIFKTTDMATKKKDGALEKIDKAITLLQAIRDDFVKFDQHMQTAHDKADKVTVKKLTTKAPSIAEKMAEKKTSAEVLSVTPTGISRPA